MMYILSKINSLPKTFFISKDLDYTFIFDKVGSMEFETRYISYNDVLKINKELRKSLNFVKNLMFLFKRLDLLKKRWF